MKTFLLGIGLLCIVGTLGKNHDHEGNGPDSHEDDYKEELHGDKWHDCYYEEEGHMQWLKCRRCCGDEGDQYCCDKDEDSNDDDDHHWKNGPHKVTMALIVGGLAATVFMVVTVSCCVFYLKHKKQQATRMHPETFSGSVVGSTYPTMPIVGNSIPTMHPEDKKFPLPDGDLYTGQNKQNNDISVVMSAPPPYSTKY